MVTGNQLGCLIHDMIKELKHSFWSDRAMCIHGIPLPVQSFYATKSQSKNQTESWSYADQSNWSKRQEIQFVSSF